MAYCETKYSILAIDCTQTAIVNADCETVAEVGKTLPGLCLIPYANTEYSFVSAHYSVYL
jgi:hypothetical protein